MFNRKMALKINKLREDTAGRIPALVHTILTKKTPDISPQSWLQGIEFLTKLTISFIMF